MERFYLLDGSVGCDLGFGNGLVTLKVPSSFQMVSFTRLTTEIGPLILKFMSPCYFEILCL